MIKVNKRILRTIVPVIFVGTLLMATLTNLFVDYVLSGAIDIREVYRINTFVIILVVAATSVFLWITISKLKKLTDHDVEKYLLAVKNASDHIVITDANGIILYANKSAENTTGYTFEEMEGNTLRLWGALMPANFYKELWQTIKYERQTFCAEVRNRRKNQEEYFVIMRISPIVDKDDNLTGFVVTEEDITDRKRIEKDLKNAEIAARNVSEDLQTEKETLARAKAKDEALLESIGEGVVATDQDGKVIVMNRVAENLLGFTSAEMIKKSFAQTISLEDSQGNRIPDAQQPVTLTLISGKTIIATYYFSQMKGMKFPILMTATPVILDAKPAGAIIVFRDITKEKEIEKLRMDFLLLASHQLRTPLSGTKWLIETMQRGIPGKMTLKQKEYLKNIYNINERMIRLVSDMLNVLRLETGVISAQNSKISISAVYDELMLTATGSVAKKEGIILKNISKERGIIETDVQMLSNILDCFISNAINYSKAGEKILLDAKKEADVVTFSVKDSGIGIPKEEQKRISERFYRASNAKGFKPNGTGLGLHIASMLAEKIGAKITFESEEGKGTTFYLRIPEKVGKSTNYIV